MVRPYVTELGPRGRTHPEDIPKSDYPEHFRINDLKQCKRKAKERVIVANITRRFTGRPAPAVSIGSR